ncbi:hypothetical protein M0D21_08310 [Aquimarina sp. D1M17]|uniref:hypothetical protein n=1 Tax=Aquimarina acroporae TaxID=2937283 RepID=UPI0020BEF5AE|nr:hypothetical protein [Aquimarina acroporae]MCK8521568.1 hypothetical protein [Aquimarina acroporae]
MRKNVILIIALVISAFGIQAQDVKYPVVKGLKQLPNGWHKFSYAGTIFDVEVRDGYLIKGNVTWFDNSHYSGSFVGNKISGKGTYTWSNGDRYEGAFRNNQRHGKGTMYWKDGRKYTGKWKNNFQNGKGKSYDPNGNLTAEGIWESAVLIKEKNKA